VAASLRRFGWQQPIVARPSREVMAGGAGLKATTELGHESARSGNGPPSQTGPSAFARSTRMLTRPRHRSVARPAMRPCSRIGTPHGPQDGLSAALWITRSAS
jgi:hypothetical protein